MDGAFQQGKQAQCPRLPKRRQLDNVAGTMATSPSSSARSGARGRGRASKQPTQPMEQPPSGSRYRRTAWAFVVLALAVITGLREWFGVSGTAGGVLHHLAAGPVGVLGKIGRAHV